MKQYKSGDEFLPYHANASPTPPDFRDGWNSCFAEAEIRITELQAQLADAKQVANDCRIVADNAIAEAKKYQWIPVSERLPKEGESVFVYSKYGQSDMADFYQGAFENCWLIDDADDTITHWVGKPKNPPTAIQAEEKQA